MRSCFGWGFAFSFFFSIPPPRPPNVAEISIASFSSIAPILGLGTVGGGVASILQSPSERHPLVADLKLVRVAVRDLNRPRSVELPNEILTTDPAVVINDPAVDVVVEVIGGIEPARTLILQAIRVFPKPEK